MTNVSRFRPIQCFPSMTHTQSTIGLVCFEQLFLVNNADRLRIHSCVCVCVCSCLLPVKFELQRSSFIFALVLLLLRLVQSTNKSMSLVVQRARIHVSCFWSLTSNDDNTGHTQIIATHRTTIDISTNKHYSIDKRAVWRKTNEYERHELVVRRYINVPLSYVEVDRQPSLVLVMPFVDDFLSRLILRDASTRQDVTMTNIRHSP
jgi:hypothetical protein